MKELRFKKGVYHLKAFIPKKNNISKTEGLKLVFDPGAACTMINTNLMDALGYSASCESARLSTFSGVAGKTPPGYTIEVPYFLCLDQKLENFKIACNDFDNNLSIDGLLGMNFFKHFRMDIDFFTGTINSIKKLS